ncbi:MAG: hypothetical protein H7Y86_22240 [Rhizobacter sp.]|nr:hypothetical protein [Ferruginibacter sp.]
MSGTYKVGSGGAYATLTAALSALRTNGLASSVILELKTNYSSAGETNISFAAINCLTASRTLTVRPEAGAAGLVINGTVTGPVINVSNVRYVTIDGRPGGTGTSSALSITNFSVNGYAILFSADASYNTLKYLTVYGSPGSQTIGVICFLGSTLSVTNGNNDNLITNCTIGSANQVSSSGIYSSGSAGKKNSRNRVVNCNIFNYGKSVSQTIASGVFLDGNSSAWEISGNSFYHTGNGGASGISTIAININDNTSSGFSVSNNFIGGSAPNCGGTAGTYTGGVFRGIMMSTATSEYSDVQGNTIQNIHWHKYSNPDEFSGICFLKGKFRCGTFTGNIIGSPVQPASITTTASLYESSLVAGILTGTASGTDAFDTLLIRNNVICGLKGSSHPNSDYYEVRMYGIYLQKQTSGYIEVSGNTIGSTIMPNSIENTSITNAGPVKGIWSEAYLAGTFDCRPNMHNSIFENTVSNIGGTTTGIDISGGQVSVKNNIIQKLVNSTGISAVLNCPGTAINNNIVRNMIGSSTGIYNDLSNGVTIDGNFIHSFYGPVLYSTIKGIQVYPTSSNNPPAGSLHGNTKIRNNMIRFGIDSAGAPVTQRFNMSGIEAPLDSTVITHNTVFIGNTDTAFDAQSDAIRISKLMNTGNRITNNIMVNERSTATNAFGPASMLNFNEYITSLAGLTLNNNLYFGALDAYTAVYKNVRYAGIAQWRIVSGMEANSILADPSFINATGDLNSVNLHLNSPTPAEANGIAEPEVTTDFDLESRAAFTPVDIGADAGIYVQSATAGSPFGILCAGGNVVLKSDIASNYGIYQWQADTGAGFADITNNGFYSGTMNASLQLNNIPSTWYGYKFRCIVNGYQVGTAYSLKFENKWTGAVSNAFENPGNWSCGGVPDGNTDMIINSGNVSVGATSICRTLTLRQGVIFTVAPGVSFTVTH